MWDVFSILADFALVAVVAFAVFLMLRATATRYRGEAFVICLLFFVVALICFKIS